jgi:hypothetical protein
MKHGTISILILAALFTTGLAFSQLNINYGLVACYPFTGNANDESGNNHNGTVYGSLLTTDRFGNTNAAYEYDGINDYIDIGSFTTFTQANEFSISVWIQPNQVKPQTILMVQPDDFYDRFNAMAYYSHNGVSSTVWDFGNCTTGGRLMQIGTTFSPAWQHFVYTVSPATGMKVYQNGILTTSQTSSSQLINRLRSLWIGGGVDVNGALFYFDGKIDDMKLYERELTAAEAQYLYSAELMCLPTSLADNQPAADPYSVTFRNGKLFITTQPFSAAADVTLYSSDGKILFTRKNLKGGESFEMPLRISGVVMYAFQTARGIIAGKVANLFYDL